MKIQKHNNGFTLVELVVAMAIFMVILMISASAFDNIMKISSRETKSAQSQIEGIVGLEILKSDLAAAGYGLPWSFQVTPDKDYYLEADLGSDNPINGLSADNFNDAPPNKDEDTPEPAPPRAVVLGTVPNTQDPIIEGSNSNPGSDYLVIKSVVAAFNNVVGKWSFVNYSTADVGYLAKTNTEGDLSENDIVVTHRNVYSGADKRQHELAMADEKSFFYKLTTKNSSGFFVPPHEKYIPSTSYTDPNGVKINSPSMVTYAIKPTLTSDATAKTELRMPFNRADYFVMRPNVSMSEKCNKGTGILYKAVIINQMDSAGGGRTLYPLLDCVGDMQVIFDLQDETDSSKTLTADTLAGLDASAIRTRLKSIRVYLLVHEGAKDSTYSYSYSNADNVITVADEKTPSLGRVFSESEMKRLFGTDWKNYRWKVYSIVGTPHNLMY